jgi:hypothetical protein
MEAASTRWEALYMAFENEDSVSGIRRSMDGNTWTAA